MLNNFSTGAGMNPQTLADLQIIAMLAQHSHNQIRPQEEVCLVQLIMVVHLHTIISNSNNLDEEVKEPVIKKVEEQKEELISLCTIIAMITNKEEVVVAIKQVEAEVKIKCSILIQTIRWLILSSQVEEEDLRISKLKTLI